MHRLQNKKDKEKKNAIGWESCNCNRCSAGMGREMVCRFAQEGAKVVAVARRAEVLEELKEECSDLPGAVEIYAGDCSKKEVCEGMVKFAAETFGKLDVLEHYLHRCTACQCRCGVLLCQSCH